MTFENPQVDEQANLPRRHPLGDFAWMITAVVGLFAIVFFVLTQLGAWLTRYVPFEFEQRLAERFALVDAMTQSASNAKPADNSDEARAESVQAYLQRLADRLSSAQGLPAQMQVRVHYDPGDTLNAYATLGGNIVIFQGLLDSINSEHGLALVLGHEIAHVQHRDPIMSLGRGVVVAMALMLVSGVGDSSAAEFVFDLTGGNILLRYGREQERAADEVALLGLQKLYGHTLGADEFFAEVAQTQSRLAAKMSAFFATHPGIQERLERIRQSQQGAPPVELVMLPDYIKRPAP